MVELIEWKAEDPEASNTLEIDYLLASYLVEIAADHRGWHKLYRHKTAGTYWELDYPNGEMHGGGPRRLRELSISDPTKWLNSN